MVSKVKDREDVIPFETICNNHNHIVWLLQQFKKCNKDSNIDTWYIDQAIKLTRFCKKQGQHLENRLYKYRTAIEGLSFKRVYKVKKNIPKKSWQE